MPSFDLTAMSVAELTALDARVRVALVRARERSRLAAKSRIDAVLVENDMSVADLAKLYGLKGARASRKGVKVAVKYRNPDDPTELWSGRGRQPRWLARLTAQGRRLEEFLV